MERVWLPADRRAGARWGKAPYPLLSPWNVRSALHPQPREAISRMQPWERQCVAETIWTVYMTEPHCGCHQTRAEIHFSYGCLRQAPYVIPLLIKSATFHPKEICLFLLSLPSVYGASFDFHPGDSWGFKPMVVDHHLRWAVAVPCSGSC